MPLSVVVELPGREGGSVCSLGGSVSLTEETPSGRLSQLSISSPPTVWMKKKRDAGIFSSLFIKHTTRFVCHIIAPIGSDEGVFLGRYCNLFLPPTPFR